MVESLDVKVSLLRPTRAIVDLDAFETNVKTVVAGLRTGSRLVAVVKADAYGHGAPIMAEAALRAGADRLAVATVGEGRRLRAVGIGAPILMIGPLDPAEAGEAVALGLEPTIGSERLLAAIVRAAGARSRRAPIPIHIEIDTGMRRHGAGPAEALDLARVVAAHPLLRLGGLATHFAVADEPSETFTDEQADRLRACVDRLREEGIAAESVHAANSAATLRGERYHFDLVRVGIALYGIPPSPAVPVAPAMRPVLSLRSRVVRVFDLVPGDTVGYGRTYRCERPERALLVPIGYADGYRRDLSNRAWMGIGGRRAPVLGRVSMDQTVVGAPEGLVVAAGDEVCVAGGEGSGAPGIDDLARMLGTIPYEVLVGIGARVPRVYVREGEVVAVDDSGLRT